MKKWILKQIFFVKGSKSNWGMVGVMAGIEDKNFIFLLHVLYKRAFNSHFHSRELDEATRNPSKYFSIPSHPA